MSNIVKSKEDLVKLKEYISLIKGKWLRVESMSEIMEGIVPRDKDGNLLVNSKISENGKQTAIYIPKDNTIHFSVDKCKDWVIKNLEDIGDLYKVTDRKYLGYYLSLFIMLHEVEHSYQRLMGKGLIEAPCKLVEQGYKTLTELLVKPNDILPRPIKTTRRYISLIQYYRNQEMYSLERNANVEAFSTILALAYESGNEEMIRVFNDITRSSKLIGYQDDSKGCFFHTFKDLLLMDKYKRINNVGNLTTDDKIRYGLEIPSFVRDDFLAKTKRRTK